MPEPEELSLGQLNITVISHGDDPAEAKFTLPNGVVVNRTIPAEGLEVKLALKSLIYYMQGQAGGGGSYHATAVHFDGYDGPEQTAFARGAALTGVSNCSKLLFSVWVKGIPSGDQYFPWGSYAQGRSSLESRTTAARVRSLGTLANITSETTAPISGGSWTNVLFSFDYSDENKRHFLLNGVDALAAGAYTDIGLLRIGDETNFYIGDDGNGNYYTGDMADLWIGYDQYLDLSNPANIAKFISGGKPVYLGANGELPTGVSPSIFFSGNATQFGQPNLGTGGAFTLTGPLTNAATSPSD